jgi:hypothetical protein
MSNEEAGVDLAAIAESIERELTNAIEREAFDLIVDDADQYIAVSTDDWTLHVEPALVRAWFAIDEEPEDPAQYPSARRAVMGTPVEDTLARANDRLGGLLARCLRQSPDAFSHDLARALEDADSETAGD